MKFGHHLGTKALKFDVLFSALKSKKVSIYKAFHSVLSFYSLKTNTIFITNTFKVCARRWDIGAMIVN